MTSGRSPLVSVVTSTYNRGAMLRDAVTSVLGQQGVEVEHIVVDNGSTDGTAALLAAYADDRVRVLRNEATLGPVGGRNTGLSAVRGEWVAILDDDDLWAPTKLEAQIEAAESAGADWAYAGCVYIDGRDRVIGGVPPAPRAQVIAELPSRYSIQGGISNVVWRRGVLDEGGLLDERLRFTVDWDVCLRLLRAGPPAAVDRPLVGYRQHGGNDSRHASQWAREFELIRDKHRDLGARENEDRTEFDRFVASQALLVGNRRDAWTAYRRAIAAGDTRALVRAGALVVPSFTHRWLRRRFVSDRQWMRAGADWLQA